MCIVYSILSCVLMNFSVLVHCISATPVTFFLLNYHNQPTNMLLFL